MSKRLPVLDGVRGMAILLVLIGHFIGSTWAVGVLAISGVELFFVLSGFLITNILLHDLETGRLSLRRFYWRRFLRIAPAYWVFLAALPLLSGHVLWNEMLSAFCYVSNYRSMHWALGHTWSLSVEEQFYLLWPLSLLALGLNRARRCLTAALLISPAVRFWLLIFAPSVQQLGFAVNADALAAGCLLACSRQRLAQVSGTWRCLTGKSMAGIYWFAVAAFAILPAFWPGISPISRSLLIGALALALEISVQHDSYLLSHRSLVAIGRMSYSLYLWQQIGTRALHLSSVPPFALSVLLGVLSYFLIEKPFLRLKDQTNVRTAAASESPDVALPSSGVLQLPSTLSSIIPRGRRRTG